MGLHVSRSKVSEVFSAEPSSNPGGGSKTSRGASGNECSISVVTRVPGYHTRPHRHDAEQINYIPDGEIWFFVEDKAYLCRVGDFQRVPRNAVHWAWNRSDKPATVIETKSPGSGPVGPNVKPRPDRGLFDDEETPRPRTGAGRPDARVPYDPGKAEQSPPLTSGFYVPAEKLPVVREHQPLAVSGKVEVRGVYGTECSLATVVWPAGYHSQPYVHDAEALIHILEGEVWFFIEDKGFKCQAGDFQRIPRNAIHWEWNPSDKPVRACVEYSPPVLELETIWLKGGITPEGWVALFHEEERPRLYGNAGIYGVTYDGSKTEARYGLK
ncbi:MAG: cupin domain-containing protein [Chloroflexota bacterium]